MSYQVLARKWRPNDFSEVVGQQHILQALVNALDQERLHHAYLFSGTRGVGKTSIARLLAKALNCEEGVSAQPCGQCNSCREIEQGNFIDLIEIDAASKTKVEDTREILDNVQYKPTRGRYKVYLIDEVHMLSKSSFNALLKTLEEPPEHVKFLFATTETQKLPITILSRCLQFNLKALQVKQIETQLAHVLTQEKISFEAPALTLLAEAAKGSMRDALSLTDQAISFANNALTTVIVSEMLGTIDKSYSLELLSLVAVNDASAAFTLLDNIAALSPDYDQLLKQMALDAHSASLVKIVKTAARVTEQPKALFEFASIVESEVLQVFYSIILQGRKELAWAASEQSGFEMVILRLLAFLPRENTDCLTQPTEQVVISDNTLNKPTKRTSDERQNPLSKIRQALEEPSNPAKVKAEQLIQPTIESSTELNDEDAHLASLNSQQQAIETQADQLKPNVVKPIIDGPSPEVQSPSAPNDLLSTATTDLDRSPEQVEQPASQFTEDELLNMSMAESLDDEEPYIDAAQFGGHATQDAASEHLTDEFASSASVVDTPALGISEFLKAKSRLKNQVQSQESTPEKSTPEKKDLAAPKVNDDESLDSPSPLQAVNQSNTVQQQVVSQPVMPTEHRDVNVELAEQHSALTAAHSPPTPTSAEQRTAVALVNDPATLLAPNTDDPWSVLIDKMMLGGRIRQLAIHSTFSQQGSDVKLILRQEHRHLNSQSPVATLQKNLSMALELPIELQVDIGDSQHQTPFEIATELHQTRLNLAMQCIESDSNVVSFQQNFGAQLMPESVKYRTIKAIN
ncbi:DNA polymerase III subunit gamma/tau [Psychrobium sp. 1_MG-2023]|uniref:DNA polymerase III subunit gamma/tau n=1 Tax=Psychrobium sp. 1_MG-2023 TaxID=3062624 RepID=UPI000C3442D2|nr:DNA polymerase III subunit gamma/tau [Psychrobium sp. 1_MG-2023]MDP2561663.1 DNA polymerase III subunit gamma/tau [Psychrobium sp. 1_MG-2023]PKF57068.1 DNA polymerase III subunit gamma/tau [Alteromonadales bacterium alter-6D02]